MDLKSTRAMIRASLAGAVSCCLDVDAGILPCATRIEQASETAAHAVHVAAEHRSRRIRHLVDAPASDARIIARVLFRSMRVLRRRVHRSTRCHEPALDAVLRDPLAEHLGIDARVQRRNGAPKHAEKSPFGR